MTSTLPRRVTTSANPIDASRWPDIATVPDRKLRARIARRLVKRAFANLPIRVSMPDGSQWGAGRADDPELKIIDPDAFFARLGTSGLIGFGESYQAGEWHADDLAGLLTIMATRLSTLIPPKLQRLRHIALHTRPAEQDNTKEGSKENISYHYDLSNDLFKLFLDPTLTYSSALFAGDPEFAHHEDLASAQHRKIDRLLDQAGVGEGTRLLEIGTGWGELALRAASRGAHVTTLTLSTEQAELARERIEAAGLSHLVDIRLQDYRDVEGTFDAIVSVEMIEAVGLPHWPTYFGTLDERLVPGGKVALQAITMPHDRMIASQNTYTWIIKYIFPGGQIPSVEAVREQVAATNLEVVDEFGMGLHYAETLKRWRRTFLDEAAEVDALGFDEVFRRMWSLYLAYSEAGFRSTYLDVVQFTFAKPVKEAAS